MEWVLQVADEVDDVLAALGHRWLAFNGHVDALWFAARSRVCGGPSAPLPAAAD